MSANRRCSTGWSGSSLRWSTTSRASPATAAKGSGRLGDLTFTLIDTAGLEEARRESRCRRGCRRRPRPRSREADAIAVRDRRARRIDCRRSRLCRSGARAGKPVILVANKSEGKAARPARWKPMRSASASRSRSPPSTAKASVDLYDALRAIMPEPSEEAEESTMTTHRRRGQPARPIRVAVVGRPNAGKSTLINRLLGEERLLTGAEAGITRDTISVTRPGRAGISVFQIPPACGASSRIEEKLEKLSVSDALRRHPLRRSGGAADGRAEQRSRSRTCASPTWSSAKAARWSSAEQMGPEGQAVAACPASCAPRPITGCRRSRACRSSRCRD